MANFEKALAYMLPNEGGYSKDPEDPGGATNFGITQRTLGEFRKMGVGSAFPIDVRYLTKEQAGMVYNAKYWLFQQIENDRVASKLFDAGVNIGPGMAIKMAQVSANAVDPSLNLIIDGSLGKLTAAGINSLDADAFLGEFVSELSNYYIGLDKPRFIAGWLARAARLPED